MMPAALARRRRAVWAGALALMSLTACAELPGREEAIVRHFPSNEGYEDGRLHIFVFQPQAKRSLDDRIRIARRSVARERGCRWIDAPERVIAAETARQSALYADMVLVAPLRCT